MRGKETAVRYGDLDGDDVKARGRRHGCSYSFAMVMDSW
jgi:hypothetical protein